MILNIRHFLLFLPIFFFAAHSYGQDEKKSIELRKILDTIALQHHVKFSYSVKDITGHSIFPPAGSMPLRAKLIYITNRTNLSFKESGENIIVYRELNNISDRKKRCAYLIDEFGTPIDNAVVQYAGNRSLVTGADGYFELPTTETGNIYVGHLGYEPVTMAVADMNDNDCLEIILKLEVLELEEIVTERYIATGISKSKQGSFIIKPRKFGILPGLIEPDVLLAMQQLPGINSIDETVSNINVRGGTHDQNLFTWNGIRLFQTGHFFGLISALNPNIAHQVRISKNGTSAFYGESVSSAIDISSRSGTIEGGNSGIGSNMINAEAYTKFRTSENTSFELSARRSFTDLLDFPTYSKYSERIFQNTIVTRLNSSIDVNYKSDKEFYFYDFTGQYHQKIGEEHNLYADLISINNKLDFTQGTITSTVITEVSDLNQNTLGGTLGWRTQWNEDHSTTADVYASSYTVDARNASIEFNQVTLQENKILDAGLRIANFNVINPQLSLHTGYQYNRISMENRDEVNDPGLLRETDEELQTHALIGELEYNSAGGSLYTRGGLRANYIEQFKMFYAEPRLQLNYSFNNSWQLEVLAEQKSQTASQVVELQGDFLGIEKRRWVLANNESIPVQKSRQVSSGFTYKDKGWLITVDNFYKKVKGITTAGQAFQDQFEFIQATGSYTVYGTEFLVQKQFEGFYAWLSYTWNDNNYHFDGQEPEKFASSFEIRHTVNTAAIYEWKNLKVALGSKWFTGRPVTTPLDGQPVFADPDSPQIEYGIPNSDNIANFFQVNFSASYTWQLSEKARLQLGVSVFNIFNRQNIINRYYRINNESNDIEVVNTYALERTPNALIKFTF